jgi:hypothetical protein
MTRPAICALLFVAAFWPGMALAQASPNPDATQAQAPAAAVLQGLDKITARITEIVAPVGETVRFGTLDITVRKCHKRPPTETPETTVYLEIRERRLGESAVDLFAGWMFASSPAAASVEHPVYDVWVVDCRRASSSG